MGTKRAAYAGVGGIVAGLFASLCCIGPAVFAGLGVGAGATGALASTAGVLKQLVPYRPYFIALALVLLGIGFALACRRSRVSCRPDASCTSLHTQRLTHSILWVAAVVTGIFILSPYWLEWLL